MFISMIDLNYLNANRSNCTNFYFMQRKCNNLLRNSFPFSENFTCSKNTWETKRVLIGMIFGYIGLSTPSICTWDLRESWTNLLRALILVKYIFATNALSDSHSAGESSNKLPMTSYDSYSDQLYCPVLSCSLFYSPFRFLALEFLYILNIVKLQVINQRSIDTIFPSSRRVYTINSIQSIYSTDVIHTATTVVRKRFFIVSESKESE